MHHDQKPYDQNEVDNIKRVLDAEALEGKPMYFEVKVDDLLVIRATNNLERFNQMYSFINEKSKRLVISVFQNPAGGPKEFHSYLLNGTQAENPLNGAPDVSKILDEKMEHFKEQSAAERVKEKLKETLEKLEDAEAYIDELQLQLSQLKAKPNHMGEWDLGKLAGSAVKEIALHYPKVLEKVPVLNGIARVIQDDNKSRPQVDNPSFEGEMSFKVKEPNQSQTSAETDEHLEIAKGLSVFINKHFDENQRLTLGAVIRALGEDTSQLIPVAELLDIDLSED